MPSRGMSRRAMSLRPVNSEKHEVVWKNLIQDASSTIDVDLAIAVDPSSKNISSEVLIGSTVPWIYLEFQFSAEATTNTRIVDWQFVKEPFGTALNIPSSYNGTSKRFVLKRGMEMLPKDVNHVVKRILAVKIPQRIKRMGDADKLVFSYVVSSTATINACGMAIYKEFN